MVVAEAMACGVPAIVMNSIACPELVDINTGFVVEPADSEAVLDAIGKIKTKGKDVYFLRCKEHIHQLFYLGLMQKRYYELYQGLVVE